MSPDATMDVKDVDNMDVDKSADEEHTGHSSWYMGSLHLITAVIGAGVLSLPKAMAWLGLVIGIPLFVVFFCITMWTARMLTDVFEVEGRKHATYREAVRTVLGKWHSYVLGASQLSSVWLVTIGYSVAAGTSMEFIASGTCFYQGIADDACFNSLWALIGIFGLLQLVLAQLPNLESLWWMSAIGATMSVGYSLLAFALGAMSASNGLGTLWGIKADPVTKMFGVFSAIGSVCFAFTCAMLVLEIQSTLREPPKAAVGMKKSLWGGLGTAFVLYMSVAITSYMALGNTVPGDVMTGFTTAPVWVGMLANAMVLLHMVAAVQMFSQPIYQAVEAGLCSKWPKLMATKRKPVRLVYRSINMAVVTGIAMGLPFFAAISGLIGAITYYPVSVLYPMLCWTRVFPASRGYKAFMMAVNVLMAIVSVLATAGTLYKLVTYFTQ